jgi:hypothetical protein
MDYKPMSKESKKYFQKIGIIKKRIRIGPIADLIYVEDGKITEVLVRNKTYKFCAGLKKYYSYENYTKDGLRIITEQYKKEHKLKY